MIKFLPHHEHVSLMRLCFKDTSLALWLENIYDPSKYCLSKLTCCTDKFINILQTLNKRQTKIFLRILVLRFYIIIVKYHSGIKVASVWMWLFSMIVAQ